MPAPESTQTDHEAKLALLAGVTGGVVVAAFVAEPIFGLVALAVGGGVIYKKLHHHAE